MDINSLDSINKVNLSRITGAVGISSALPYVSLDQEPDVFVSSFGPLGKPSGIFGKIADKVREVATQVNETINSPETKQKINAAKIAKLFVDNGTVNSYQEAYKHKDLINELAKHDYNLVSKKYNTILKNVQIDGVKKGSTKYLQTMGLGQVYNVLMYDKLQAEDIDEIFTISRNRPNDNPHIDCRIQLNYFVSTLKSYEDFDNLSAKEQKDLMQSLGFSFPTYNALTKEEAKNLSKHSPLTKFEYVSDLRNVDSQDELVQNLDARRRNIPCRSIPVDKTKIEKVLSQDGIENLTKALNKTDITKYEKGLPLEYSRKDFIQDFNKLTKNLSNEDKKKVFEHFGFKINSANDIINFPNPDTKGEIDDNLKNVIEQGQEYINRFMLENKVKLAPEDKALETELNNIIQAFPEFVSVIGKPQHRGDSIDYHTIDDMKRILNDENFKSLSPAEQKILTTATLFHDFGKVQGEVDEGHAKKSAVLTKEILKKTDLSFDEKERIYNLINHSHWLVDGRSNEDIAFDFRRPNDFKMAEMYKPEIATLVNKLDSWGRYWKDPSIKEERLEKRHEYTMDSYGNWYEDGKKAENQALYSVRFIEDTANPKRTGFWLIIEGMAVDKMEVLGYSNNTGTTQILQSSTIVDGNHKTVVAETIIRKESGMHLRQTWTTTDENGVIVPEKTGETSIKIRG